MLKTEQENNFGYILYKIGDIGPEQIYYENLPPELEENFSLVSSVELGLYLSLVISQGKGMDKEGLFGPLPWYQLPDFELLLFSFLVNDPETTDDRKKSNTLCFLTVLFPRHNNPLIQAKYEIERSLSDFLIKPKVKRLSLNEENIEYIITMSKNVFTDAMDSGTKITQEKDLDEVINQENLDLFAIYSANDRSLKSCLIGEASEELTEDDFKPNTIKEYQISVRGDELGGSCLLLEFEEKDTIIYMRLKRSVKSHTLINLLAKIDSSLEILSYYI